MTSYSIFWLSYFHFWFDLTWVILSFLPLYANRVNLYADPLSVVKVNAMLMMSWHILNMLFIHWIITKVGFLFIDAEVLRRDNEELLDGLEEGVIILEKK